MNENIMNDKNIQWLKFKLFLDIALTKGNVLEINNTCCDHTFNITPSLLKRFFPNINIEKTLEWL
jgi:hypothetical protein